MVELADGNLSNIYREGRPMWHVIGCGMLWCNVACCDGTWYVAYCDSMWHVMVCGMLWCYLACCDGMWHVVIVCGMLCYVECGDGMWHAMLCGMLWLYVECCDGMWHVVMLCGMLCCDSMCHAMLCGMLWILNSSENIRYLLFLYPYISQTYVRYAKSVLNSKFDFTT